MEGVMMRTPNAYAIACRKLDGSIVHTSEFLPKWSEKHKVLNLPILRGGATLIQSMALGIKALNFSASIAHDDMEANKEREKSAEFAAQTVFAEGTTDENFTKAPTKVIMPEKEKSKAKPAQAAGAVGSIIFALFFNVLLFIVAPLLLTNVLFIAAGWATAPEVAANLSWLKRKKARGFSFSTGKTRATRRRILILQKARQKSAKFWELIFSAVIFLPSRMIFSSTSAKKENRA